LLISSQPFDAKKNCKNEQVQFDKIANSMGMSKCRNASLINWNRTHGYKKKQNIEISNQPRNKESNFVSMS
jgi:hypothetical protein